MKMFAFTSKHHEGFSMFDTKTRVKSRANWTAPGGPRIESCDLAYSIMETPFRRDIVKDFYVSVSIFDSYDSRPPSPGAAKTTGDLSSRPDTRSDRAARLVLGSGDSPIIEPRSNRRSSRRIARPMAV